MTDDAKYRAFCSVKGRLGERIVQQKHFSELPKGVKIIDGHKPFDSINLKPLISVMKDGTEKKILPCHLDLVGVKAKNEVTFICEVKTTINSDKSFHANGYCPDFMKEAQDEGIPTYFAVVRLDRDFNRDIVRGVDIRTGMITTDIRLISSEFDYAFSHAKVELYKQNKFRIDGQQFLI